MSPFQRQNNNGSTGSDFYCFLTIFFMCVKKQLMQLRCKIQPFWSIDCTHTLLQLPFKIWKHHTICFYDVIKLFTNRRLFLCHNWIRLQSYGSIILSLYFFILEGCKVYCLKWYNQSLSQIHWYWRLIPSPFNFVHVHFVLNCLKELFTL